MKTIHLLSLLSLLALAPACTKSEAKDPDVLGDASKAVKEAGADAPKVAPEGMQQKFSEITAGITKQLQGITDQASATSARTMIEPMIDQLSKMKDQLAGNLPSLDSISKAVDGLKAKFADDEAMQKVLAPLMEKLQALLK